MGGRGFPYSVHLSLFSLIRTFRGTARWQQTLTLPSKQQTNRSPFNGETGGRQRHIHVTDERWRNDGKRNDGKEFPSTLSISRSPSSERDPQIHTNRPSVSPAGMNGENVAIGSTDGCVAHFRSRTVAERTPFSFTKRLHQLDCQEAD